MAACARQREGAAECDALEDILKCETVQMGDQSHREHGLWAIDSLNANAWPSAAGYLATTSADIVPVQEAKVEQDATKDTESAAKNAGNKK